MPEAAPEDVRRGGQLRIPAVPRGKQQDDYQQSAATRRPVIGYYRFATADAVGKKERRDGCVTKN